MATKLVKFKTGNYGIIPRGTSFLIPVYIKDEMDKPLDLSEYKIAFTVKRYEADFDRHDDYVFCKQDFEPQAAAEGHFWVALTSKDTDFDPGEYFFDIELVHKENGMVWRVVTLQFTLKGGPTNRHVNPGVGQLPTGDTISVITMSEGAPIVVIAPTVMLGGTDVADVYSKLADVLNAMESLQDKVNSLEEEHEDMKKRISDLEELI